MHLWSFLFYFLLYFVINLFLFFFFISSFFMLVFNSILWLNFSIITCPQPKTKTIHSHYNRNILDMMQGHNIFFLEPWQDFINSYGQQFDTFFICVGNYKAVYMDERHFLGLHTGAIVVKLAEKFYGIHWKVHVEMIRGLECRLVCWMFFVYFFDCLSSAHVPTFNPLFYCIYLAISN